MGDKPPVPGCRNDPIVLSEDPPFSFPPPFFLRLRNSTSLVSSFVDSRPRLCVLDSNLCVILSVRTSSSSTPRSASGGRGNPTASARDRSDTDTSFLTFTTSPSLTASTRCATSVTAPATVSHAAMLPIVPALVVYRKVQSPVCVALLAGAGVGFCLSISETHATMAARRSFGARTASPRVAYGSARRISRRSAAAGMGGVGGSAFTLAFTPPGADADVIIVAVVQRRWRGRTGEGDGATRRGRDGDAPSAKDNDVDVIAMGVAMPGRKSAPSIRTGGVSAARCARLVRVLQADPRIKFSMS